MAAACIPEPLPVKDIPSVAPQLVVSTQIVPDRSLLVLLTRTFGALDANEDSDPEALLAQLAVTDATVTVSDNDTTYTLIALGSGAYGGILIPLEPGTTYRLDIVSPSLGTATATATVQAPVTFEDVKAALYFNGYDDTLCQVSYRFRDPIGLNRYMVNLQRIRQEDFIENILNPRAYTQLLEDTAFEGQEYEDEFRTFQRGFRAGDTVVVLLSNIGADYYRFMSLREDNRFSFTEYLSEPVNYPTNVQGGRGYFNLYVPDIRTFVLQEE